MSKESLIAEAIDRNFTSPNVSDSNFENANIVDVINYNAVALLDIGKALERLGTNGAGPMGAIEVLALEVKEGTERVSAALLEIAEAIRDTARPS